MNFSTLYFQLFPYNNYWKHATLENYLKFKKAHNHLFQLFVFFTFAKHPHLIYISCIYILALLHIHIPSIYQMYYARVIFYYLSSLVYSQIFFRHSLLAIKI